MKKFCAILAFLSIAFLVVSSADAAFGYYYGKINKIRRTSDYIIIYYDNDQFDDCKWQVAFITEPVMTKQGVEAAYVMALSAFYTGQTIVLTMDKEQNGEYCYATSIGISK